MRQAGHNDPENKKMFGQYAMGLEFAEWTGMRWRAPNMDSVDVEDLEWVIVRGCVGIPDFAFEPCDVEELTTFGRGGEYQGLVWRALPMACSHIKMVFVWPPFMKDFQFLTLRRMTT